MNIVDYWRAEAEKAGCRLLGECQSSDFIIRVLAKNECKAALTISGLERASIHQDRLRELAEARFARALARLDIQPTEGNS